MNNKHVFWQAFLIASAIFWIGILLGTFFEKSRVENIKDFYFDSETDVFDFQLASEIVYGFNMDCSIVNEKSVFFADQIYEQAKKLEKYDNSNKLTKELISLHKRYDLLRTMLWRNTIENKKRCGETINTVIYLYQYDNPSLTTKATQGTMSNFLFDLKDEYGDKIVLIPIAVDTGIESLNILRENYGLDNYPVIFINEKAKFENWNSLDGARKFLYN